jgi:transposase
MQPPLPHEGTARGRSQADEELGLKQLWIERWKEGGERRPVQVKGRSRKLVGLSEKSRQRKKSALTSVGDSAKTYRSVA